MTVKTRLMLLVGTAAAGIILLLGLHLNDYRQSPISGQQVIISAGVGLLLLFVIVITGMRTVRALSEDATSLLATTAQMQADLEARAGKERAAATENDGMLSAIAKSMAQIEFDLDGTIRTANSNFLNAVGYSLEEIKGHHHRMFVPTEDANTTGYRTFWDKLRSGQHDTGQYRRVGKGGRELWLQASYNPILDAAGKPFKVVKFATDVSEQVRTTEEVRVLAQSAAAGDLTRRVRVEGKSGNLLA
jgi:PAS domain S-box-containing protein